MWCMKTYKYCMHVKSLLLLLLIILMTKFSFSSICFFFLSLLGHSFEFVRFIHFKKKILIIDFKTTLWIELLEPIGIIQFLRTLYSWENCIKHSRSRKGVQSETLLIFRKNHVFWMILNYVNNIFYFFHIYFLFSLSRNVWISELKIINMALKYTSIDDDAPFIQIGIFNFVSK